METCPYCGNTVLPKQEYCSKHCQEQYQAIEDYYAAQQYVKLSDKHLIINTPTPSGKSQDY